MTRETFKVVLRKPSDDLMFVDLGNLCLGEIWKDDVFRQWVYRVSARSLNLCKPDTYMHIGATRKETIERLVRHVLYFPNTSAMEQWMTKNGLGRYKLYNAKNGFTSFVPNRAKIEQLFNKRVR